jgi:hypothetical protein
MQIRADGSGAPSFADFDNDGWQDLYAANGWIYNDRDTEPAPTFSSSSDKCVFAS